MRRPALALIVLSTAVPFIAMATDTATTAVPVEGTAQTPLKGSDCLNPAQTRSFLVTGDREVIIDSGRRKYRLSIGQSCPALSSSPTLAFRGDQLDGRLCGGINDAVVTSDYPCKVDRVELLTAEQYKAASDAYVAERKAQRKGRNSKGITVEGSDTP
jgi:Family of unknown function (DUF6491)